MKDPSDLKKWGKVLEDIGLTILGFAFFFKDWKLGLAGVVIWAVGFVIRHWDEIKEVFKKALEKIGDWFAEKKEEFIETIEGIGFAFEEMWDNVKDWAKDVWKDLKEGFGQLKDTIVEYFKFIGDTILAIPDFIVDAFIGIGNWFANNVFDPILDMGRDFGERVGNAIGSAFKAVVNGVLSAIERILNAPIRAINTLIDVINTIPNINLGKLNTFSLPRLKVGGIVNMPNRGTLLGNAVVGESGAEGVIPLTDEQAMSTLGEAIGRHVNIQANIINKMNGRLISRELVNVENNQAFAYNG